VKKIFQCLLLLFSFYFLTGCSHTYVDYLQPKYSQIKQGQLEYYRFGQGSPIVLIAGYATDLTSWSQSFLTALAKHHQVIVFNNRNVAKSYVNSTQYNTKVLAHDTYQLMQNLNLHQPTVIGISMGGMIAQQVAVDYPTKISHLVLINTLMPSHDAVLPSSEMQNTLYHVPTTQFGFYLFAVNNLFSPSTRWQMSMALITDRFDPYQHSTIDIAAILPAQRKLILNWMHQYEIEKQLSHLHIPTLILNGMEDAVIPPANSVLLANTIPHAELLRWRDGGHGMVFQYPCELADSINRFIDHS
jgi:pimeloyl-ACP methyl ester carboxylesterase